MTEIYPSIENSNFNYIIANHPDFKNFKSEFDDYTVQEIIELTEKRCNSAGGFIYKNIQLLVSSFISLNTPYNGLLLYHGVGVGKTCSSLLISNNFKEYVKKNNKKIIILTKPAIQEGFKNEIFDYKKRLDNVDKNLLTCISNEYTQEWEKWKEIYSEEKYEEFRNTIISEYYEIYGYQEFTNKYKYLKKKGIYNKDEINNIFSNTIIIIDEVHNLRDEQSDDTEDNSTKKINTKESKEFLNAIFENLNEPIKLILLSATPMYDKYEELEFIINILKKNDKNKDLINLKLLNDIITETDSNKLRKLEQTFYSFVKGYVSYMKGNDPFIFPKILLPKNNINIYFNNQETYMPIIECIMSKYQKKIYKKCKEKEKVQYSNLVLPLKDSNILLNFDELFSYESKSDSFINLNEDKILDLFDNLDKYSCKLNKLKNILNQNTIGKIFIYSSFIKPSFGGGKFISILLEILGFQRKIVKKNKLIISNTLQKSLAKKFNNQYYIRLDGETSVKDRKIYIDSYNNNNNIYGENIKIIIGSTNLFEGVSLFNVREIHILEPWYNKSRYEQIIGRGYRQCSHKLLPFEERNITIYNYIAVSNTLENYKIDKSNNYIINDEGLSMTDIDLRKIQLSNEKMDSINKFDKLLKKSSIDCLLNNNINSLKLEPEQKTSNINKNDVNIIEQINSKKEHLIIRIKNEPDTCFNNNHSNLEEYNILIEQQQKDIDKINIFINPKFIENIKYFIKQVIIESNLNYFTINHLYNQTLKKYNNIDLNIFKIALQELIITKEIIFNKFNIQGFITINGSYIIFKPFNINNIEDFPIEFIQYPFKNKLPNLEAYDNYSISLLSSKTLEKTSEKTLEKTSEKTLEKTSKGKSEKTSEKTSKDKSKKTSEETSEKTSKETLSIKKTSNNNIYDDLLDIILNSCNINTILDNLNDKKLFDNYFTIWTALTKADGKNHPNFNKDFTNDIINNYINNKTNQNFYKILFHNLFYKPFDIELYNNYNINISNERILNLYKINLNLIFIFNYSPIISTYLKCIFHKKYILKNIELSDLENSIYNNYNKYIVSENPLIFKFVDFSRDNLNVYDYKYLQNIYYEYIVEENIWKIHQYDNSKVQLSKHNIQGETYNFYKLKINKDTDTEKTSHLLDKEFIKSELKLDQNQFDIISKSFHYNKYSNLNDGYYYYSGDINNPIETNESRIENRLPKFSNIIGCTTVTTTNTTRKFKSKLSRIVINLSFIYSKYIVEKNKNIYFKNSFNSGTLKLHLPNIKEFEQIIHVIYCVIDQIYELNYKIILDIIINNKDKLDVIWISDYKYNFKEFYSYNFNNKDEFELQFNEEQFNKLILFLNETFKINITDKYSNIFKKINNKKDLLYNHIYVENILKYFKELHINNKTLNLNNTLKEHYYTKLLTILLYDLNNVKFYNKRWLLDYYESCLLNPKVLNIDVKANTKYNTCKEICADVTSIPGKSVWSFSKDHDKRRSNKLIELDS